MRVVLKPGGDLSKPLKREKKLRKPINKTGKETKNWLAIRRQWFTDHPQVSYTCQLRFSLACHKVMIKSETTLDHVIPKSNAANYKNRHDYSNLQPACYPCNSEKGSKVYK